MISRNPLKLTHPTLYGQLNRDKNPGIDLDTVGPGSNRRLWWLDEQGHSWQAAVNHRAGRGDPCPFCSGRLAIAGENDLATLRPNLFAQVDLEKNTEIDLTTIKLNDSRKLWWLDAFGHSWQAQVVKRVERNQGCPQCSGRVPIPGKTDLGTLNPELAAEFHPTLNDNLKPVDFTSTSGQKVWWLGKACGHAWKASIAHRKDGTGCPYCAGLKTLAGFNDLTTMNPELAAEFHPTKNAPLTPSQISPANAARIWWLGATCGHEWQAAVYSRAGGNGCAVCAGATVVVGVNDLETLYSDLAAELHPTKNSITAQEVTAGSSQKLWWLGSTCGHEWEAPVYTRTRGSGCFRCWQTGQTSKQEQLIADTLQAHGVKIEQHNRTLLGGRQEIDIYAPDAKIGIEYNGLYWHSEAMQQNINYHHTKWAAAAERGIQLIQIWEDDWIRSPELITQMLLHKLGAATRRRVYARKTVVKAATAHAAREFLQANHIQGFASGSIYEGLYESEKLVALLVAKRQGENDLRIERYATNASVIGGFTKLLKHIIAEQQPDRVITFSDNMVSDGALYAASGFERDAELGPDYSYLVSRQRREHKFNYRIERFRTDPALQWTPGLSEKQLADLNGLHRIWDAGKVRWVWTNPSEQGPPA